METTDRKPRIRMKFLLSRCTDGQDAETLGIFSSRKRAEKALAGFQEQECKRDGATVRACGNRGLEVQVGDIGTSYRIIKYVEDKVNDQ